MGGASPQVDVAFRCEWLLLRAGSHEWRTAAGHAHGQAELDYWIWQRWPSGFDRSRRDQCRRNANMPDRNPEMALGVPGSGVETVLRAAFRGLLRNPQRSHAPADGPAVLWRVLWRAGRHIHGAGLQNRSSRLAFRDWPELAGFADDLYGRRHTVCGSCGTGRNLQFCSYAVTDRSRMGKDVRA